MNEVKEATMFINLSLWQQAVGLIIALIIAISALWLFRKLRGYIWMRATYIEAKIAELLNRNWGVVLLLGVLLFFGYIIFVIIFLFGQDKFTESIVVASALTVFIIFQLPRLLKPHIHITLLPPDEKGRTTQLKDMKTPVNSVDLLTGTRHVLYVYISNLGINIYENWGVFLTFDKEIELSGHESSSLVSYMHQERNNAVICVPNSSMPFGPDDNLILNTIVKTPDKLGQFTLKVTFKCSTRWGETEKDMYLNVTSNEEQKE